MGPIFIFTTRFSDTFPLLLNDRVEFSDWVRETFYAQFSKPGTSFSAMLICEEGCLAGWLVVWVLWHLKLCRLYNAKSIFMKIVLFQTIQSSRSTQFKCMYSLFVKNFSISRYSV